MKRRLKEPFGKAGLTVAILALVLAMVGGAWAAAGLNSKQKKEVKSIAKSFQGTGPAGANGANGTNGTAGAKGDKGEKGDTGNSGAPGTSVTNTPLNKGEGGCPEGGAKFTVGAGTPTKACNGTTGFTETLPPGKTEEGTWGTLIGPVIFAGKGHGLRTISFSIPLASALPGANIKLKPEGYDGTDNTGEEHEQCPGKAEEPKAKAGFLCVYATTDEIQPTFSDVVEVNTPAGVVFNILSESIGFYADGTWAVTAE